MSLPIDEVRPSATSIAASERYAQDRRDIEEFARTFFMPRTGPGAVATQLVLRNLVPQLTATATLLGYGQKKTWAMLSVPPNYFVQRMTGHYLVASLSNNEVLDAAINKVEHYMEQNLKQEDLKERQEEAKLLVNTLKEIKSYHGLTDTIFSLMNQFLHA